MDAEPAIELMPPAQLTFPSIASGTVEIGLPTSGAVLSASITADVATGPGVSPLSLPSLLVPTIAFADLAATSIGDGHTHPAVQPTTSCKFSENSVFIY